MKKILFTLLPLLITILTFAQDYSISIEEELIFKKDSATLVVKSNVENKIDHVFIDKDSHQLSFVNGVSTIKFKPNSDDVVVTIDKQTKNLRVRRISALWSIVPPLLAIIFALVFKEVVPSMILGVFTGAVIFHGLSFSGIVEAFKSVISIHILNALSDSGHVAIIIFSMIIGGMVAVISRNGGMAGIVKFLSKHAQSSRSSQIVTYILGLLIFFDDYANTLVVGNTMRSVTDKFKVSREKLAYIVDSTAAPVAAIAFITTWIGAELGYIADAMPQEVNEGVYSIFLNSLRYAFYPILTLVFMFMLIWSKKEFGPMKTAEEEAKLDMKELSSENKIEKELEEIEPKKNISIRGLNALIPILTVINFTVIGLLYTGSIDVSNSNSSYNLITDKGVQIENTFFTVWSNLSAISEVANPSFIQKLGIIIGNSDSYQALLWSSLLGLMVAIFLSVIQKILTIKESFEATINGFKSMLPAFVILTLAWSLASITEQLHTAEFLTSIFSVNISQHWMATITFILAAIVSFSTGSSWGTMAILYPLIIKTTYTVCTLNGLNYTETMEIIYNVVSVVLAGSVLGDHCSPISDTTILSSMATQCNHVSHVKTQLPYALTVGGVSVFCGGILVQFGIPWYLNFIIGFALVYAIVRFIAKPLNLVKT